MALPALSKAFFDSIRRTLFHGTMTALQVSGMQAMLAAANQFGYTDIRWLAYLMATAYHETGQTMQPVPEIGRGRGRAYGVPVGPWKQIYYGRGWPQITWWANYLKYENILKIPLTKNPDLALQQDVTAQITAHGMLNGTFTTRKLADYINGTVCDFVGARHIINGTDCANAIAVYANNFLEALKAA